jgi:Uma2 family endonuclease
MLASANVMGDAIARPHVSYADYLAGERDSDVKHEWFDGAVYAMSRGTPEHARLSARIARIIGNAVAGDCDVYSSDMMLYVAEVKLSTYADASLVCGPLETIAVKKNGKSIGEGVTNPTVIVEVRSDSTERYDREEKFGYYRRLSSLAEYVLVAQDEPLIEVYRRPATDGRWTCEVARSGQQITIHGAAISVDSVYGSRDQT